MTIDYDPFGMLEDPWPVYKELRDREPVFYQSERDMWLFSRYDDIATLGKDWETYTAEYGADVDSVGTQELTGASDLENRGNINELEPPVHDDLRRVVQSYFFVRELKNVVEDEVRVEMRRLIEEISHRTEVDFATEFAWKIPPFVVSRMFGFPDEDRPRLERLMHHMGLREKGNPNPPAASIEAAGELDEYITFHVEQRRANPTGDLLTRIAHAELDGKPISVARIVGLVLTMILAQSETTQMLMSNGLYLLAKHPEQRAKLLEDPNLIGPAVEEILRFAPPLQHSKRTTTKPVEFHGKQIPAGATVLLMWGSANRDERHFDDPDTFDVERYVRSKPVKSMTFGHGVHTCIGLPLARMEGRVAFEEILARIPDFELNGRPERFPSHLGLGWGHLPLRITRTRELSGSNS
jgi:cytochrome P450